MLQQSDRERFAAQWIPVGGKKARPTNGEETEACNRGQHRKAIILLF
jgi:hypothetical protein